MLTEPTVLALSLAYLGLLFAIAYFGDRYARDWSASSVAPAVYGLSLAIYCTSWTFYGAVGRAATSGIDFILIYTGPALVVVAGYPMLRKMVRLAKQHNVTSIADFLASRYGKSRPSASLPPCSPRWACCPTSRCSCRPSPRPSAQLLHRRRWRAACPAWSTPTPR